MTSELFSAITTKGFSASRTGSRAARAMPKTFCRLFSCGSLQARPGAISRRTRERFYIGQRSMPRSISSGFAHAPTSVSLDVVDFDQSSKLAVSSPEDHLADTELRELIRHAVANLEGRAAAAFALRYYEGYDNGRIAEILGTSQMVVAVTLHRARTRLRKEIGNYLEKHHEAQ